jgi:lipopolysaccharide export LptBFGC system permease protein LptF
VILLIYLVIDFVEVGSIGGSQDMVEQVAYWLRVPSITAQILPIALLLGVMLALANLRSHGEWDAMRAAGISTRALAAMLIVVSIVAVCPAWFLLNEIGPRGMSAWQGSTAAHTSQNQLDATWIKHGTTLVRAGPGGNEIIVERNEDGTPLSVTMKRDVGPAIGWRRADGWHSGDNMPGIQYPQLTRRVNSTQGNAAAIIPGATFTSSELDVAVQYSANVGLSTRLFRVELALRMSLVLACLILPLFGLTLGFIGEEARASRLVGRGIVAAVVYWFCLTAAWNGASIGAWSPMVLSIGVPCLFGVVCLSGFLLRTAS